MRRALLILRDVHTHSGDRILLLLVLLIVCGVSDGISMALLYPLIETAGIGAGSVSAPGSLGDAFRQIFEWAGVGRTLINVAAILIGSFLVQAILVTAQNWLLLDIQKRYIASWQKDLYSAFVSSEWSYFVAHKSSELVNSVMVESLRLGAAFFALVQLMVAAIILCFYLAIAFVVSWKLMLYLSVAAVALVAVVHPIRAATRRYGAELGRINADILYTLTELLNGTKLIKTSAAEAMATRLMSTQVERLRLNLTWGAFLPTTVRSVFEFGAIIIIVGALIYGIEVQRTSPANLLLLVALVARLLPRLMNIQIFYNLFNLSAPSFDIVSDLCGRFRSHRERQRAIGAQPLGQFPIRSAEVVGRGLVVRYDDRPVLDGISFTVAPGQIVGFVGPSGAGKTTLVDSIIGLITFTEGDIAVDGVPLGDLDLQTWRGRIGYVSQDTFLFHDTIANNIRWDAPDTPMPLVEAAGSAAGLDQFIGHLPDGYETVVGDRGVKVSGGQRQRISMARALLREPALLILDEATSALDSLSEQEMVGVVSSLRGRMSIVIVAHRFTAVRNADLIYVLDRGRIVEQGTWDSLSGGQALFRRLMDAQAFDGPAEVEAR